jgi:hypothetical protein
LGYWVLAALLLLLLLLLLLHGGELACICRKKRLRHLALPTRAARVWWLGCRCCRCSHASRPYLHLLLLLQLLLL